MCRFREKINRALCSIPKLMLIGVILGLLFPLSAFSEDIKNVLTRVPPADKATNNGGGSRTGDAEGWYYKSASTTFGIISPGAYGGAKPWTYVWGTRYSEGWSEGWLGLRSFNCIRSGTYDVTIDTRINGLVAYYVPRAKDTWGWAKAYVDVSLEWKVFDETDSRKEIFKSSQNLTSGSQGYCVGECAQPEIYSNYAFTKTCPDLALVAGHEYSAEIKIRCWGKGEASGATNHSAYYAVIFTSANLVYGPWNQYVNGGFRLNSITFQDKSPDNMAPVTSVDHAGGTYCEPVTVTLSAAENPGGYGFAKLYYQINNGSWVESASPSVPIEISSSTVLRYYATDKAGNIEGTKTQNYHLPITLTFPTVSYVAECDYIDINWGAVNGATEYCVYRDGEQKTCTSNLTWRDEDPGVSNRCYTVQSKNECFESIHSAPVCCQVKPIPAAAVLTSPPSGEIGLAQPINLQWDASAGADDYTVQIADNFEFNSVALEVSTSGTNYAVSGLENVIKYYWRVRGENDCGLSNWSNIWNFTTECPDVSSTSLTSPNDGSVAVTQPIDLIWEVVEDAMKYEVQIDKDESFASVDLISEECAAANYICQYLDEGVTFYWRARASNGCAWSDWSPVWSFLPGEFTDLTEMDLPDLPDNFILRQNYPNPFNPETIIEFGIPSTHFITIDIYNILGKKIETLLSEKLGAGYYSVTWNGADVPTGIYFYRIQAGSYTETRKMILLK